MALPNFYVSSVMEQVVALGEYRMSLSHSHTRKKRRKAILCRFIPAGFRPI